MVQALEQTAREILTLLQGVHQGAGFQDSECRGAACSLPQGSGEKSSRGKGRHPRSARAPLSRAPGFQSVSVARGLSEPLVAGGRQLGGFEPDEQEGCSPSSGDAVPSLSPLPSLVFHGLRANERVPFTAAHFLCC